MRWAITSEKHIFRSPGHKFPDPGHSPDLLVSCIDSFNALGNCFCSGLGNVCFTEAIVLHRSNECVGQLLLPRTRKYVLHRGNCGSRKQLMRWAIASLKHIFRSPGHIFPSPGHIPCHCLRTGPPAGALQQQRTSSFFYRSLLRSHIGFFIDLFCDFRRFAAAAQELARIPISRLSFMALRNV